MSGDFNYSVKSQWRSFHLTFKMGTLQFVEHSNGRRMKSYTMRRKKRYLNFGCSNLIGRNQFIPLRHTMLAYNTFAYSDVGFIFSSTIEKSVNDFFWYGFKSLPFHKDLIKFRISSYVKENLL